MKNALENIGRKKDDVLLKGPFITILGNKVQIENYKKIYKVSDSEIIILFKSSYNNMVVQGENLRLVLASTYMLIISGTILNIKYPKRESND